LRKHFKGILIGGVIIALALWRILAPDGRGGSGEALAQVRVPELNAAETAGKAVFDKSCARCHGENAAGKDGFAPPLVHRIYEPNHHADIAFQRAAKLGVRAHHWTFGNMPPVKGISDEEIGQVVTYVRALQRANGIN